MNGFSSLALTLDKEYLLAGDFRGFIHVFQLKNILKSHVARDSHDQSVYAQTSCLEVAKGAILSIKVLSCGSLVVADRESLKIISSAYLSSIIINSANQTKPRSILTVSASSDDIKIFKAGEDQSISCFLCRKDIIFIGCESGIILSLDKKDLEKPKYEANTVQYLAEAVRNSQNKGVSALQSLKANPITALQVIKGGRLAVSSKIGIIQLWNIQQDGSLELNQLLSHDNNYFFDTIFSLNSISSTLFCGHNGFVTAWNIDTNSLKFVLETKYDVFVLKMIDHQTLAVAGENSKVNFYDINTRRLLRSAETNVPATYSMFLESSDSSQNNQQDTTDVFQDNQSINNNSQLFVTAGSNPFLDVFYNNQIIFLLANPTIGELRVSGKN